MGARFNSFKNRVANTAKTPFRLVGSSSLLGYDLINAGLHYPKEIFETLADSWQQVGKTFSSIKTGKTRMKRFGRALLSPFVSAGVLVEGAVRSVLTPSFRLFGNVRDSLQTGLCNIWETIGAISKNIAHDAYVYQRFIIPEMKKHNSTASRFQGTNSSFSFAWKKPSQTSPSAKAPPPPFPFS